jgi:hypothetical protein
MAEVMTIAAFVKGLLRLYAKLNFLLKNQKNKHLCDFAVNISG